nr:unnamed protein product [Digitaria exilis]
MLAAYGGLPVVVQHRMLACMPPLSATSLGAYSPASALPLDPRKDQVLSFPNRVHLLGASHNLHVSSQDQHYQASHALWGLHVFEHHRIIRWVDRRISRRYTEHRTTIWVKTKGQRVFLAVAGDNNKDCSNAVEHAAAVERHCAGTLHHDVCASTLATIPNIAQKPLRDVISEVVARAAAAVPASSSNCSSYLLPSHGHGLRLRDRLALSDCLDLFGRTLAHLDTAADELSSAKNRTAEESIAGVQTVLAAALTNQYTCLDGFDRTDASGHTSRAASTTWPTSCPTPSPWCAALEGYGRVLGRGGFPSRLQQEEADMVVAKDGSWCALSCIPTRSIRTRGVPMAAAHRPLLVKRDVEGRYLVHDMCIENEQTLKVGPLPHPIVEPLHHRPLAVAGDILGNIPPPSTAGDTNNDPPPIMLAVGDDTVIKMDTVIYYRESSSCYSSGFEMITYNDDYGWWRAIPLPRPPFRTLRHPSQSVTIRAYFAIGTRVWISVSGEGTFSLDAKRAFWQAEFPEELCRLDGRAFFAPELGSVVGLTAGDDRFLCSYKVDEADMKKWTWETRSGVPMTWQHTWREAVPWECFDLGYAPWKDKASLAYLGDGTFCVYRPVKMLDRDLNFNSYMVLQLRRRLPDGNELEIARRGAIHIKGIWPEGHHQDTYFIQTEGWLVGPAVKPSGTSQPAEQPLNWKARRGSRRSERRRRRRTAGRGLGAGAAMMRRPVHLAARRGLGGSGPPPRAAAAGARPLQEARRKPAVAIPNLRSPPPIFLLGVVYAGIDPHRRLSGVPPDLVPLHDYCLGMPVVSRFTPAGAVPLPEYTLLAEPAQAIARGTLLVMNDLFDAGLWLTRVGPETFLVNVRNRSVFLSPDGWAATSHLSDDPSTGCCEVNACVSWLAVLLEDALFTANKQSPLLVPEFGSELLLMMKEDANRMWYAILNHLVELVLDRSPAEYTAILNELVFPVRSYTLLSVLSIPSKFIPVDHILFTLYRGSVYDSTADTKKEQAEHFGRFLFSRTRSGGEGHLVLVHVEAAEMLVLPSPVGRRHLQQKEVNQSRDAERRGGGRTERRAKRRGGPNRRGKKRAKITKSKHNRRIEAQSQITEREGERERERESALAELDSARCSTARFVPAAERDPSSSRRPWTWRADQQRHRLVGSSKHSSSTCSSATACALEGSTAPLLQGRLWRERRGHAARLRRLETRSRGPCSRADAYWACKLLDGREELRGLLPSLRPSSHKIQLRVEQAAAERGNGGRRGGRRGGEAAAAGSRERAAGKRSEGAAAAGSRERAAGKRSEGVRPTRTAIAPDSGPTAPGDPGISLCASDATCRSAEGRAGSFKGMYNGEPTANPASWPALTQERESVAVALLVDGRSACSKTSRRLIVPLYASLPWDFPFAWQILPLFSSISPEIPHPRAIEIHQAVATVAATMQQRGRPPSCSVGGSHEAAAAATTELLLRKRRTPRLLNNAPAPAHGPTCSAHDFPNPVLNSPASPSDPRTCHAGNAPKFQH